MPKFSTRVKTKDHHFRSKFEASIYSCAKASRKKLEFEPKDAIINYTIAFRYQPDFRLPNGILIEAKGLLDVWDRRKMIAVKEADPALDIRFVFQSAKRRLSRNGKTYAEWAEQHGFPHAEGIIPLEWWREGDQLRKEKKLND